MIGKICPTCNQPFNAKRNSTVYCSKLCAQRNPLTKEKMLKSQKIASLKKYGVEHPMKSGGVVSNFKKSMADKYGVEHALQSPVFVQKSYDSKVKKYGDGRYNNVDKAKQTCLEKYGKTNYAMTAEYKESSRVTCIERYGVDHPSKSRAYKVSHSKTMFEKFMSNDRFVNFTPRFTLDDYRGVTNRFNQKYPFECKRCGLVGLNDISNGKPPKCHNCDTSPFSCFEREVYDFVKEMLGVDVIQNDRTTLYPREIDVLMPSLKIGIECDGLYWHSENLGKKNKVYHSNKTTEAMLKEIRLIHIFENEWRYKNEIVKSILRNILKKTSDRIFARNCKLVVLSRSDYRKFIVENHIQGADNPSVIYALTYHGKIVSAMSFCKSRFDAKYQYELSRFCNILNTNVVGGATKLFTHFLREKNPENVVSYSDKRYFSGDLYLKLGMSFVSITPPNYFYIVDGYQTIKSRMSFQKHKLKKLLTTFDQAKSEWENMKGNGFDRIWDCGHSKWIYTKK